MENKHVYWIIAFWFLVVFEVIYDLRFAGYILLAAATFALLAGFYSLYIEDVDSYDGYEE